MSNEAHDTAKYQSGNPPTADQYADTQVVISSDTLRAERIPAGQTRTKKWPVLHATTVPEISQESWSLRIFGLVKQELTLDFSQFLELPQTQVFADFHCVTRWSRLGNLWQGVATNEIKNLVELQQEAKFVLLHGYDNGWTTNLSLDHFFAEDALLAFMHDQMFLNDEHGGPVRGMFPKLYAWKSAKWLKALEFVSEDTPGYWEQAGYHHQGNPWVESKDHPDGERFESPGLPPPGFEI